MHSILNLIELSSDYLAKKGIESPRLNAELLLAHILKSKRIDLYLLYDKPLSDQEVNQYRELIKRRSSFEPLQYITGYVEFFGLRLNVNRDVLIPRPETELLVETIINLHKEKTNLHILDIGCGSGNIAIALAKNLVDPKITALDISKEAINIAKENSINNEVQDRINFLIADFKDGVNQLEIKFDIIVSNPPYVSINEYRTLQKEILNYEPKEAVTDLSDGFSFYDLISKKSYSMLNKYGKLFFEIGKDQFTTVKDIMLKNNFNEINCIKDYQNIERIIYGVKN